MARHTQRQFTRGHRRPTKWGGTVAAGITVVPALSKILMAFATPEFPSGETIRRIRGTLFVRSATSATFHGAIGAFIANDTAIAAGVASLLDPVTNVADDAWLWYQSFHGSNSNAGEPGGAGARASQVYPIDSKAMRRMDIGFAVVFVVANASVANSFEVALSLRVLGSEAS